MSKGAVDEALPSFAGSRVTAGSQGDGLDKAILQADVVLYIEPDDQNKNVLSLKDDATLIILSSFLPGSSNETDAVCQVPAKGTVMELFGDVVVSIANLTRFLSVTLYEDWSPFSPHALNAMRAARYEAAESDAFPLRIERVVHEVQCICSCNSFTTPRVCLDNGQYKTYFSRNLRVRERYGLISDTALATMVAGMPSAIVSIMAQPNVPVICVIGDGGLYMTPLGCWQTAQSQVSAHPSSSLTILVLENEGFGMIEYGARYVYNVPEIVPKLTFDSRSADNCSRFRGVAEAFGAKVHSPRSARELRPALRASVNVPGLHLIECPVDYSESDKILASV
eukprot:TRINITY_DN57459_c0_g1_i1.p1 TRINITY_DN57459_c0_g1~~TRINITY_DN57459_c0_g1_i1.p1  ORF type:complete len:362 (+),score=44.18 TRINITY_DN57459_c0_g1_i1:73-1086(+)